jgi:protein-S-isoprenylcysteine O-methyltransferase Ste14
MRSEGEGSAASHVWLGLRSIAWTILLPGLVAGYIPWRFFGLAQVHVVFRDPLQLLGLVGSAGGAALLAACVWEFARSGRGTLSPADPPSTLVIRGLYRYVRNPMYLSVSLIVLGEALLTRSRPLLVYWAVWFAIVNIFVMAYEEPSLRRRFGDAYLQYSHRVGRWLPRRHA